MSSLHSSQKKVWLIILTLAISAMVFVGFTIAVNPPTDDIPEPSIGYASYSFDNMFRYVNDSQGGLTTNLAEFHISFDNIQSGNAFLRLRSVTVTIWVKDVTSNQANISLIGVDDLTTTITFNPSRDENIITVQSADLIEGDWWATGICSIDVLTSELLSDMAANIQYAFRVNNRIAEARHGHQFHVKVQADVTYHAYYLVGLFNTHYQDMTYNWTLGDEYQIYMLPYGE
ncbi:MAG: hypothetical protein ACXADC_17705 [Candidatus Thorarchaeota archaeon]|jgi:hypothetical protein